ncbi:lipoprotein [Gandjariella thermophila]|uniref:Lipoprotein n=2 Tax=Gandjariella thermophila TaxID=1931992 RepID=A0A4D4JE45_9PSEU|nr:lipoprotein [Gandjariella thermophila]
MMALATAMLGAACTGNGQAAPANKATVKSVNGSAGYGNAQAGDYGSSVPTSESSPAAPPAGEGGAPTAQLTALKIAPAGSLSNALVDQNGRPLYRFDKDSNNPSTSNCDGQCAQNWPPVIVANNVDNSNNVNINNNVNVENVINNINVIGGIDKSKLGVVKRKDGSMQLTVNKWPMYWFAKDSGPGQANGEGAMGTWWVAAFNGTKAKDGAMPPTPGTTVIRAMPAGKFPKVATDGEGFTLYRFDKDVPNKASNCNGECAKAWPPVLAQDNLMLYGIDRNLVGTITRADGSKQLTLGGWPLYRYAKDTAACQTNGEAVGGVWWTAAVNGKKAKDVFPG